MVKKRVHELAKELNIESKEIIKHLVDMGVVAKSHMSTLEEEEIQKIKEKLAPAAPKHEAGANVPDKKAGAVSSRPPTAAPKAAKRESALFVPDREESGLVDKVPSRPPDRRFADRRARPPVAGGQKPAVPGPRPQPLVRPAAPVQADRRPVGPVGPVGPKAQPDKTQMERNRPFERTGQDVPRVKPGQGQHVPGRNFIPPASQTGQPREAGPRPPRVQDNYARPGYGDRPRGPRPEFRPPVHSPGPDRTPGPKPIPAIPKPPQEKGKVPEKPKNTFNKGKPAGTKERYGKPHDIAEEKLEKLRAKTQPGGKQKRTAAGKEAWKPNKVLPMVEKKPIVIGETVSVQELAEKMKKSPADVIKRLMGLGVMATINQEVDSDTATIIANEFGFEIEVKVVLDPETLLMQEPQGNDADMAARPPVVTVMGHVDHGKTSLLDAIRETNVIATEAGGITQHIGAYQVETGGRRITFIDTPGHEAFTAMRARGTQITDVAVLVVAADDGVMPQTVEAINHAREAKVPIIVAINKIDKPEADMDKIRRQLTMHGLVAEDWGGDTIVVPVSATKKTGLKDLLEMILLVAEMGELKANSSVPGRGTVIEAELDKGRGPVATVLVQSGTLKVGDVVVAGSSFGKVRAMVDDKGKRIKKAHPSTPVEVLGLSEVPQAGDIFLVAPDEKMARTIAEKRLNRRREEGMKTFVRISLDDVFKQIKEGQVKELRIVIKADVQGTIEALTQSLERLSNNEVKVNIIHSGVGAIRETDIMLASASNAIVIGFNVRPDANARRSADQEKIDIRLYRVIYDAINDVRAAMTGLLDPEVREVTLGRAEVRKIYKVSKIGTIAGCHVIEGKITRDAGVRLIRDNVVIFEGKLDSLKRFKDDAKEVMQGYECGITLLNYNDILEEDIIEAFTTEKIQRELPDTSVFS